MPVNLPRFFPLPADRKKKREEDRRRPIVRLLVMERARQLRSIVAWVMINFD